MKKISAMMMIAIIILLSSLFCSSKVYAEQKNNENEVKTSEPSQLVELKEKELQELKDYEETYGSKTYGLTAYILNKVRIFSIPLCFLGILIGAILNYVIGVRHLENKEKGLALMISFVTLAIICQVLPLVFTIVVKFGRE